MVKRTYASTPSDTGENVPLLCGETDMVVGRVARETEMEWVWKRIV